MSKFIKLQMFKDQNSKKSGAGHFVSAFVPLTFAQWQVGFFVKSALSNSTAEWKITEINSNDGAMHSEDCVVTLQGADGETRTLKGSSLRSGYAFASTGDVVMDTPAAPDVPARDDVLFMTVNIDGIREFYPRKYGNEGSRLIMLDKTAYIIADTTTQVNAAIEAVGGKIVSAAGKVE